MKKVLLALLVAGTLALAVLFTAAPAQAQCNTTWSPWGGQTTCYWEDGTVTTCSYWQFWGFGGTNGDCYGGYGYQYNPYRGPAFGYP